MIVVDVETTGLDPKKNSIISIGAVDLNNPQNTFYLECQPFKGALVSDAAIGINGADWLGDKSKPTLKQAIKSFIEWSSKIQDHRLAGNHVAGFDSPFLMATAKRYHINWDPDYRIVDLYSWYCMALEQRSMLPVSSKTDVIFNYVGLPNEPKPHIALMGAKMEAEGFSRLLGKKLFKEFESYPIPGETAKYLLRLKSGIDSRTKFRR